VLGWLAAVALLGRDAWLIAKPLMGRSDVSSALRSGAGRIASIAFTAVYLVLTELIYGMLAFVTPWPIVGILLCVGAMLLLRRLEGVSQPARGWRQPAAPQAYAPAPQPYAPPSPRVYGNDILTPQGDVLALPVVNYSADSALQPAQVFCSRSGGHAALVLACYTRPETLKAIQVRLQYIDEVNHRIDAGHVVFKRFSITSVNGRTFLRTETAQIPGLHGKSRRLYAAKVVIEKVGDATHRMRAPASYHDCKLSLQQLTALKRGGDLDVVCLKSERGGAWQCACGRMNHGNAMVCVRCQRGRY